MEVYFHVLVFIVGLLTNGALVFILTKTKVGNLANTLILNLAVADLLVLLFYLPFTVGTALMNTFPFGEFICKLSNSAVWAAAGASAFTLLAMMVHSAVEGRNSTTTPPCPRWKRIAVVAGVWALAIVCTVSTMVDAQVVNTHVGFRRIAICGYSREVAKVELPVRLAVYIVIPVAVFAYLYFNGRRNRTAVIQSPAQKDFSRVVPVLFSVYVTCFVPFYLLHLWIIFQAGGFREGAMRVMSSVFSILSIAYRCLNPVALYCASGAFRQLFRRHVLCCCYSKTKEAVPEHELHPSNAPCLDEGVGQKQSP